jgi:hypothetical protein
MLTFLSDHGCEIVTENDDEMNENAFENVSEMAVINLRAVIG